MPIEDEDEITPYEQLVNNMGCNKPLSRERLITTLREMESQAARDWEEDHLVADGLLLDYIGDPEITAAFKALQKWYA